MGKNRKLKKKSTKVATLSDGESAETLATEGERLMDEGNFNAAKNLLTASLKKEENSSVLFMLASCLLELNKPQEARQQLLRCCELSPDSQPDQWLTLAELEEGHETLKCLQKGAAILEHELKQPAPMNEDGDDDKENVDKLIVRKLSNVYVCISELYTTDLCDEPNAEEMVLSSIKKAMDFDPLNPDAVQAKAAYHLIKQEFDLAKQEIKKSLDMWLPTFEKFVEGLEEDTAQIPTFNVRLSTVKLLMDLEMFDEAINVLDGLVLEDEDCVDVWYLLGFANFLQGSDYHSNAKFYLKKAQKVAADYSCDDKQMVEHIAELLNELKAVETDDEEENHEDDDWETDDD